MFFEDLAEIQKTLPEESVMNQIHTIVEENEDKREDEDSGSLGSEDDEPCFDHLEYRSKPRNVDIFVDRQNQTSTRETDKTVPLGTRETDKTV